MRFLLFLLLSLWASALSAATWVVSNPTNNYDALSKLRLDGSNAYLGGDIIDPSNSFNHEGRLEMRAFPGSSLVPGFGSGGVLSISSTTESLYFEDVIVVGSSVYVMVFGSTTLLQKRDKLTGALDPGFGTGGTLSLPWNAIHLASDGSALYLAGSQGVSGDLSALLEKRDLTTGALVGAFGAGGQVVDDRSTNNDRFRHLIVSGGMVLVGGTFDQQTYTANSDTGFVERFDAATGAPDAAFGNAGFVTTTGSAVTALQVEGSDYVIGGDDGYNGRLFLARLAQADGSLVGSFGSGGQLFLDPGAGSDTLYDSLNDASGGLYVACSSRLSTFDRQWYVAKFNLSDGSPDSSFGSSGVYTLDVGTGFDVSQCLQLSASTLYVGGYDEQPLGDGRWRVEALSAGPSATATPTATETDFISATASASPTATPTLTSTASSSATASGSPTSSASPTASPLVTLTASSSATLTQTDAVTATPTPTSSATLSATSSGTATAALSATFTLTITQTSTRTPTPNGLADAYEPDDTYLQASALTVGDLLGEQHTVHVSCDQDWMSFAASAGVTYVIETFNLGSSTDTVLYLYNTNGTSLLTSNDDSGLPPTPLSSRIQWTAPVSGTYFVEQVLYSCSGRSGVGYSFSVRVTVYAPPTATPTRTITLTPSTSPTYSVSPTVTATRTISPTFSVSPTCTVTPTASPTRTPTPTGTISPTFSASPSATPSRTISPTSTISPTFSASPTAAPTSACSDFGGTAILSSIGDIGNYIIGSRYTLSTATTLNSMSLYLYPGSTGNVRMGIYSNGGGNVPGVLLAESNNYPALLAGGWMTVPMPAVSLAAGDYWLVYDHNSTIYVGYGASGSSNTELYYYYPLGPFPSSFTPSGYQSTMISIKANACSIAPTPTPVPAPLKPGKIFSYPNPFLPGAGRTCTLIFEPAGSASVEVWDWAGRRQGRLDPSNVHPAQGLARWDGRLDSGLIAPPGLYFMVLRTDHGDKMVKMTVVWP